MPAYLVVLFTAGYWQSLSLPQGCSGNPCKHWRRFARGDVGLAQAVGLMAFQLRLAASASCVSDLTVPGAAGFGLEFLGVFADSMLVGGLAAFSSGDSWLRNEEVQRPLLYVLSTWLTYHGLYLTGMFSNPANASAQTLGCRGTPLWLHFAVYWAAPLLAVSLGHRLEAVAAATQTPAERHEKQQ
uniref:EXPERA domain-containing protein n=1 Tax=Macrostomum lignano TaxID=282301 RepID=A0A1I8IMI0_9PLAT